MCFFSSLNNINGLPHPLKEGIEAVSDLCKKNKIAPNLTKERKLERSESLGSNKKKVLESFIDPTSTQSSACEASVS
ncbi:hypothetical protein E2542_SST02365 [Spatholobus suberectus]|nr:hypothetical protein E2542_SST02365 [Spatholobus suberectus]